MRLRWLERFARPRWRWRFGRPASAAIFGALALASFLEPPFSGLDTLPSIGVESGIIGIALTTFLRNLVVRAPSELSEQACDDRWLDQTSSSAGWRALGAIGASMS
jgi:hypothetical protein